MCCTVPKLIELVNQLLDACGCYSFDFAKTSLHRRLVLFHRQQPSALIFDLCFVLWLAWVFVFIFWCTTIFNGHLLLHSLHNLLSEKASSFALIHNLIFASHTFWHQERLTTFWCFLFRSFFPLSLALIHQWLSFRFETRSRQHIFLVFLLLCFAFIFRFWEILCQSICFANLSIDSWWHKNKNNQHQTTLQSNEGFTADWILCLVIHIFCCQLFVFVFCFWVFRLREILMFLSLLFVCLIRESTKIRKIRAKTPLPVVRQNEPNKSFTLTVVRFIIVVRLLVTWLSTLELLCFQKETET